MTKITRLKPAIATIGSRVRSMPSRRAPPPDEGGQQRYSNVDGRLRGRALQERRLKVWAKDPRCANPKCRVLTVYPEGFALDHIQALTNGGADTEDQVQVLCHPCHDEKTAMDMGYPWIGVSRW